MRTKVLLLLIMLLLLTGCGKKARDPLLGTWRPNTENPDKTVYLFREDGTGEVHVPSEKGGLSYDILPMTYRRGADTLAITFADGSVQICTYSVMGDRLTLNLEGKSGEWRYFETESHISSREMGIQFWTILAGTMGVLYLQHLIMPYDYRFRPSPDQMPDRFAGTFSQGQLVQFLLQSVGMPLIYELELVMVDRLELPRQICVAVGVVLILLWGLGPRRLARRIDGW